MSLEQFCGNYTLNVFKNDSFGACFLQVYIFFPICFVYFLVTLVFCCIHWKYAAFDSLHRKIYWFRFAISFFILCTSIISLILSFVLPFHDDSFSVNVNFELTYHGVTALLWLSLLIHDYYHGKSMRFSSRGPWPHLLFSIMYFYLSIAVTLSITRQAVQPWRTFAVVTRFTHLALVCLHLLSKVPVIFVFEGSRLDTLPAARRNGYSLLPDQSHAVLPCSTAQTNHEPQLCNEDEATCLSKVFFCWIGKTIFACNSGELTDFTHLPHLPSRLDTAFLESRIPLLSLSSNFSGSTRFMRLAAELFGREFCSLSVLKLFLGASSICAPVFLNYFIIGLSDTNTPYWYTCLWGCAVIMITFISAVVGTNYDYRMSTFGYKIRVAVTGLVYRTILLTPLSSLCVLGTGSLINYLTDDASRIVNLATSLQEVWAMPLQLIVAISLLYKQLGVSSLVGVGFLVIILPLNRILATQIAKFSTRLMHAKDARIKRMSEILSNMVAIKVSCWERLLHSRVSVSRSQELKALWGQKMLDAVCVFFWAACPAVLASSTFATYSALGNRLEASVIFTSLALFSMLIGPMNSLPWVINGIMEAVVSVRRISRLLSLPHKSHIETRPIVKPLSPGSQLLCLSNANFHWSASNDPVLTNISLNVISGQLIGVTGPVGSGKSALLLGILGELHSNEFPNQLDTQHQLRFAYISQTPWLFSGTIRDNILLGSVHDAVWLEKVIAACALETDLTTFPDGIDSYVGESGGSRLSGGQRARVALARAVYQQADVYLLDDPLSALDARVAEHVVEHCLLGLLAQKTRIITASHQNPWFLRKHSKSSSILADEVIELRNGRVLDRRAFAPVVTKRTEDLDFDEPLLSAVCADKHPKTDVANKDSHESSGLQADSNQVNLGISEDLVDNEQSAVGAIETRIYWYYLRSAGYVLAAGVLLSLILMQASRNASDWWLAYWVGQSTPTNFTLHNVATCRVEPLQLSYIVDYRRWFNVILSHHMSRSSSFYLSIYGAIIAGHIVITTFRAFLFALSGLTAAKIIQSRSLDTILQASTQYFAQTPQGRILNRFSSDVGTIDDGLPFILNILLANVVGLLGVTIVSCVALPSLIVVLMPMTFVFWSIQRTYRGAARDLKRIASVVRSPVYAHFVDTLSGLPVIRGLMKLTHFRELTVKVLSAQLRADLASLAAGSWLNIRLQLLSVGVVAAVISFALVGKILNWIEVAAAGLSAAYALSIAGLMTSTVYIATETEKNFIAVERCQDLTENTPVEAETVPVTATAPVQRNRHRYAGLLSCAAIDPISFGLPYDWPRTGSIEFRNVSLTYPRMSVSGSTSSVMALRNIDFSVNGGERVGLVGRTGSGKSSILRVLLRLVDHLPGSYTNLDLATRRGFVGASGMVFIDGIDIRSIPLRLLRSQILTIVQEPFLFSGTLRENLDPSGTLEDDQLCDILYKCRLASNELEAAAWLSREISEAGRDVSAGQRQLICLARALLRHPKPKIVCLDEATATVDEETEEIIHDILNREFPNATILLIAHRLSAVKRFCSRALVMNAGQLIANGNTDDVLSELLGSQSQLNVGNDSFNLSL